MKSHVQKMVQSCATCQRNKWENLHPAGLLQPHPLLTQIWSEISMDFIEAFPVPWVNQCYSSWLIVSLNRLSLLHQAILIATTVAHDFFKEVYRLHGLPTSIVSDRDKIFQSHFWRELFRLSGTKLAFSTAYHPQTDGENCGGQSQYFGGLASGEKAASGLPCFLGLSIVEIHSVIYLYTYKYTLYTYKYIYCTHTNTHIRFVYIHTHDIHLFSFCALEQAISSMT